MHRPPSLEKSMLVVFMKASCYGNFWYAFLIIESGSVR